MKFFLLTGLLLANILTSNAQNCANTSTGKPAISDLGTNYWNGLQGGLYSNGLNTRPTAHNNAGLLLASQVLPLDTAGNIDMINGDVVWLSVGMSNTTLEAQAFITVANTLQNKNPKLVLVDGAKGGWDIDDINDTSTAFLYWNNIVRRLAAQGVTQTGSGNLV